MMLGPGIPAGKKDRPMQSMPGPPCCVLLLPPFVPRDQPDNAPV